MSWPKLAKKRVFFSVIFLLFLAVKLGAVIPQGTIEAIYGRYSVNDPRFEAVYDKTGPIQGLGLSSHLITPLNFYLEIKYFQRKGALTYTKEKSDFYLLPISLGLRVIIPFGLFHPFIGTGVDIYTYSENNPIATVVNFAHGFHGLAGFYFQIGKLPLFLSARLKYTRVQAEEERGRKIQLGGIETGVGLVFSF